MKTTCRVTNCRKPPYAYVLRNTGMAFPSSEKHYLCKDHCRSLATLKRAIGEKLSFWLMDDDEVEGARA